MNEENTHPATARSSDQPLLLPFFSFLFFSGGGGGGVGRGGGRGGEAGAIGRRACGRGASIHSATRPANDVDTAR